MDFDSAIAELQVAWRRKHVRDQRHGEQNGLTRPWILPHELWHEGVWEGSRESLLEYIRQAGPEFEKHRGVHNLKSSWVLCANLYYPFGDASGLAILAGFLRNRVSPSIKSVSRVELEYAEKAPLDPQTLLGEPPGKRGANQTSPDIAFVVETGTGIGLVLTENKLSEHSFYGCSGRKKDAHNPDANRCLNWAALQADIPGQCWQLQWAAGTRKNRKYWDHIQVSEEGKLTLKRCPAATAGYQLFRQQALAEAIAAQSKYDFVASCVAYDARNATLVESLRSTGIADFATGWGALFTGKARFAAWTHQEWVSWVKASDVGGQWGDWIKYVEERYGYA